MGYCRAMARAPHPIRINSAAQAPRGFAPAVVADLLDDALGHGARVYAIAGLQGSGKSTLASQIAALARERGLRAATPSIDDVDLGPRARRDARHARHVT